MKFSSKSFALLLLVGALILAGCATTPERRIQKNPELFESLPADVQEQVKEGKVGIGFTPEMVYLALGEPDRRVTRRTADEERVSWYYEGRYLTTDTIRVHDYGRFSSVEPVFYLDRTEEHRYTRARIDFVDGKVAAIQQVER